MFLPLNVGNESVRLSKNCTSKIVWYFIVGVKYIKALRMSTFSSRDSVQRESSSILMTETPIARDISSLVSGAVIDNDNLLDYLPDFQHDTPNHQLFIVGGDDNDNTV